jgi:hypothetical protein
MRESTRRRPNRSQRSGSPMSKMALKCLGYFLAYVMGATSAGVGFLAAWGAVG